MSQRIFFSALLILWLASRASADGGDDFANNLASDLGPIIALFGERVVMQFMSQAMGIADCILLAVAPIGAITTVVSAIRVAGPAWLKSFIGRARENIAAAEVEVMSSTSTETCELWNGHSVVRCPGSAGIYQFICLVPEDYKPSKRFDVKCRSLETDSRKLTEKNNNKNSESKNNDENTELLKPTRRSGPTYLRQSFRHSMNSMSGILKCLRQGFRNRITSMSSKLKQVFLSHRRAAKERTPSATESQQESSMGSPTNTSKCSSHTRVHLDEIPLTKHSETKNDFEVVVIKDDGSAPNLLLNCHDRVGRGEIYFAATIGLILQLGAVVYFGFITYYKPIQDTFLKDGRKAVKYAFPCAAIGTLLLVLGLFICSWVVGESTKETCYEAENHEICVVWLQKDHTVSDQVFKPFAVYPTSKREYITMSRRNIKYRQNEIGDLILNIRNRLFNYKKKEGKAGNANNELTTEVGNNNSQLTTEVDNNKNQPTTKVDNNKNQPTTKVDSKSLYWPLRSITFIGALISLIGFVSQFIGMRGLNWTASIVQLGITILVTILRVIVRRGLGKRPAHTSLNPKFELDWFVLSLGNLHTAPWFQSDHTPRDSGSQNNNSKDETFPKWEIGTGSKLTYHKDSSQPIKDSEPHRIMQIRKRLGELAEWNSPFQQEAAQLSKAIDAVADKFLKGQSEAEAAGNIGSSEQSREIYTWSIPAIYTATSSPRYVKDDIYITISKDKDGIWRINEAEIEAILSLWLYSTSSTNHSETRRSRSLRVYGPNEAEERLNRDLEWWMRGNIPKFSRETEEYVAKLTEERSGYTVVGFRPECDSVTTTPTEISAPNDRTKEYLVLECQDNQQRLYSRHLFYSFMRAVAKLPGIDIAGASSTLPLDPDIITEEWKEIKLANETISTLAHDLEKIGFGPLSDIYIDLIVPLSFEHKLTNAKNIIDEIARTAHEHERSLQWKKLVGTCINLLNLAQRFDLEKESSGPLAIVICLGFIYRLKYEAKLQYSEQRSEEEFTTQFKKLEERFKNEKIQRLVCFPTTSPNEPNFSAVSLNILASSTNSSSTQFPKSFHISDQNLEVLNKSELEQNSHILDIKDFEKTDAFGWSLLHYAANLTIDIGASYQTSGDFPCPRDFMGWTPLHHACFFGNEKLVYSLLDHGALIEVAGNDGITPMHCAVQSGNAKITKILLDVLKERHRTNSRKSERHVDRNERHPIHWAAVEGNVEMIRLLKDDIDLPDRFGWTAIHLAAIYGYEDVLQCISENHTVAIDAGDNALRTPLHLAVENERIEAVQVLVDANAKINTIAKDGSAPLHVAMRQKQKEILGMLLEHRANIEAMDKEGRTPLYLATEDGENETIKMLIDKGAMVNAARKDGRTPLHIALSRGQDGLETAKILLEAGADANTKAEDNATALHIAAQCGSLFEVLNVLPGERLKSLDFDATDEYGQTPLLIAIYEKEWEAASLLLDMGADVNADKRSGYSPVLGAVVEDNEYILQKLLEKGASVNDADGDGYSALHLSILNGNQRIFQALLNANANIDALISGRNDTPLHIAVRTRQLQIVQALLAKGASTTILNFRGFSPLQQALYSEDLTTARKLIEHDKLSTTKAVLQKSEQGDTPLHTLAAGDWHENTKCTLLEELLSISPSIDINAKNDRGHTPLDVALFQASGHYQYITNLLEKGAKPGSEAMDRDLEDWREDWKEGNFGLRGLWRTET